jgi:tRNA(Ile)-lysidine synthase
MLFAPGEHVVCAVSGGADSMAMLWCLHSLKEKLGISVSAAHFNHHLRGAESDRDAAFVRDFCEERGIALAQGEADVRAYCKQFGVSEEVGARHKRYAFFASLACDKVATAHNADDNTETVLLHLLRGTGLRGLGGIPPKNARLVRPILWATRKDILRFLEEESLPWIEDSTNAGDTTRRNRLRHWVLPVLREEEPAVSSHISEMAELLRGEDALLDAYAADLLEKAAAGEDLWRCDTILEAPDALQKRALRLLLRPVLPVNLTRAHIQAVQQLLAAPSPSAQFSLPEGIVVRRQYENFTYTMEEPIGFAAVQLQQFGITRIPELGIRLTTKVEIFEKNEKASFQFALRCAMIRDNTIHIRPRQRGDRIALREKNTVKLKKLFVDRKIPRWERERIPILTMGDEVLAVFGVGVDYRYTAVAGEPALIIHIEKEEM